MKMDLHKTIKFIASKLGIASHGNVLCKAAEFERLLQSRSLAGSNISDTCKTVICLDLACSYYNIDLDSKSVIKYSGLKSPSYMTCRKTVENLLELNNEKLSIASLCLTLNCTSVQTLAETMMTAYQHSNKMEIDTSLPQYVCIAVFHACRLKKVKVSKSKLIEKSRLKAAQWTKLDADWLKFVTEKYPPTNKKDKSAKKISMVEENDTIRDMEIDARPEEIETEESYEDWRRRILENAYKELKLNIDLKNKNHLKTKNIETIYNDTLKSKDRLENMESECVESLRRSPRKTPVKLSVQSVKSSQGVRLLFK